jgi:hypothetical protein
MLFRQVKGLLGNMPYPRVQFPRGRRFAFSVFDDADNGTVENLSPVYELLNSYRILTTKSVWVYPPRGRFSGQSLMDDDYLDFVMELKSRGFEIALHGVGDGVFTRQEIVDGFEIFRDKINEYPRIHTNHSANPSNIYWRNERFVFPVSALYSLVAGFPHIGNWNSGHSLGSRPHSTHFWGDLAKNRITYMRNLLFNSINTLACDPAMPYKIERKANCSNLWFSSSDGHTVEELTDLLAPENLDRLEEEGGACIVYTHFASGFVGRDGRIVRRFREAIENLAARDGWYVPVGTLLDHLRASHAGDADPGYWYELALDLRWLADRIVKRIRYHR